MNRNSRQAVEASFLLVVEILNLGDDFPIQVHAVEPGWAEEDLLPAPAVTALTLHCSGITVTFFLEETESRDELVELLQVDGIESIAVDDSYPYGQKIIMREGHETSDQLMIRGVEVTKHGKAWPEIEPWERSRKRAPVVISAEPNPIISMGVEGFEGMKPGVGVRIVGAFGNTSPWGPPFVIPHHWIWKVWAADEKVTFDFGLDTTWRAVVACSSTEGAARLARDIQSRKTLILGINEEVRSIALSRLNSDVDATLILGSASHAAPKEASRD